MPIMDNDLKNDDVIGNCNADYDDSNEKINKHIINETKNSHEEHPQIDIQMDPILPSSPIDDNYDEEELRDLAASLSPKVSALLDSNEKELENILNGQERAWKEEEDKFALFGSRVRNISAGSFDSSDNDDDDDIVDRAMRKELNSLSAAEQALREELEMSSVGFSFIVDKFTAAEIDDDNNPLEDSRLKDVEYSLENCNLGTSDVLKKVEVKKYPIDFCDGKSFDHEENNEFCVAAMSKHNDIGVKDEMGQNDISVIQGVSEPNVNSDNAIRSSNGVENIHTKSHADVKTALRLGKKPPSSTGNQNAPDFNGKYTIFDHAKVIDLRYDSIDNGHPTCPLLTKIDAEFLFPQSTLTPSTDKDLNHVTGDMQGDASPLEERTHIIKETLVQEVMASMREYVRPMTCAMLSKIYVGLADDNIGRTKTLSAKRRLRKSILSSSKGDMNDRDRSTVSQKELNSSQNVNLLDSGENDDEYEYVAYQNENDIDKRDNVTAIPPVRVASLRIRSDVLCGAVMDAVYATVQDLGGEMTKRQGGHLRAIIPGCHLIISCNNRNDSMPSKGIRSTLFSSPQTNPVQNREEDIIYPPFLLDAQLCVRRRSRDAERMLLIRTYRIEDNAQIVHGEGEVPPMTMIRDETNKSFSSFDSFDLHGISSASLHDDGILNEEGNSIVEAAALAQRIQVISMSGGKVSLVDNNDNNDMGTIRHTSSIKTMGLQSDNNLPVMSVADDNFLYTPQTTPLKREKNSGSYIGNILTSPIRTLLSSNSEGTSASTPAQSRLKKHKHNNLIPLQNKKGLDTHNDEEQTRMIASARLLSEKKSTPSVLDVGQKYSVLETIPALSPDDILFVRSSWRFLKRCINELDNRDLAYSTLQSSPFGAFPSLPTLDVHYCSQLKILCRENMIMSLIKAATELEEFARESEYSCANLIQLLSSTFKSYGIEPPRIPRAFPLSAYPLDFQPAEITCPPWGQKVVEALNLVAAESSKINTLNHKVETEFAVSLRAVSLVLSAFQRQEDDEFSAKLGRKNVQVMDRLANMQQFKRKSVLAIRDSYRRNLRTTKAADLFHNLAEKAIKLKSCSDESINFEASDQIPLLQCRILLGSSTGTCYLTAHQMLLVTQLIPILGGTSYQLFNLQEIKLKVLPPSNSILNPLPARISIETSMTEDKSISFIPSLGAERFQDFVKVLKTVENEDTESSRFNYSGGIKKLFDEKKIVAKAALG